MTPAEMLQLIEANPSVFKPAGAELLGDGYPKTRQLETLYLNHFSEIDNPAPAPHVPRPFDESDLALAAPNAVATLSESMLIEIGARAREQNRSAIVGWARIATLRKAMSQEEATAIESLMAQTIPDPSHPATVTAPQVECLSGLISEALGRELEMSAIVHPQVEQIIGRQLADDERAKLDARNAEIAAQLAAANPQKE